MEQVLYTLDVAQYAIGARATANFYRAINKALQKREPELFLELSGSESAWLAPPSWQRPQRSPACGAPPV
jgi:hypothetical protein